jgi:hypothetical protein
MALYVLIFYTLMMLFFLQADPVKVEVVMWALFAFEALTGIMINYAKIELVPMNLSDEEANIYAAFRM